MSQADDATPPPAAIGRASVVTQPVVPPAVRPRSRRRLGLLFVSVLLLVSGAGYGAYRVQRPVQPVAVESSPSVPVPAPASPSVSASPTPARTIPPLRDGIAPSGVPMPIGEIPGWYQTFTDDFVGNSLNDQWFRYSGGPSGDNGGWFMPSHVSVGGGILTVKGAKEQTPRGVLYATGGVSNHNVFSQKYGRFDVRFRMDRGVGIAYAILLWPTSGKWPPELDIIEDNGRDRQSTSATMHYDPDDKKIQRQTRADFTQWHTATLEWTPGHLVYRLDGKVWATIDSSRVPDEPMDLALQTQAWGCGGTWEACPNSTTPPEVNLQIDWVSLYGWTGP
jgi:hypothetical protein